jgi:hypothetical protein
LVDKNLGIIIFVSIFFLVTGGLSAQNAQELTVGSTASGHLNSGAQLWYSVRADQTGFLVVETLSDFDTILEAYDGQRRNMIAMDDDGGEAYNARLEIYAASGAVYLFKLRGHESEGGPFRIKAAIQPLPRPVPLHIGTPQSANLSIEESHWYSLRAAEDGAVIFETAGNIDTYMEIYDTSYALLDSNNDDGEDKNACIELRVTAGRTYLVRIKGNSNRAYGPYSISANVKVIPPPVELRFGTRVDARLTPKDEHWYFIKTTTAGLVIVETSGNVDTFMEAYDSSNNLLMKNDDGGRGLNALIELDAAANQTYLFKITRYTGQSGPYSVMATYETAQPDTERNTERARAAALKIGEPVPVRLRANNESRWYSYNMTGTGAFTVYTSGSLDTLLYLYDSQGIRIAEDDDSGGNGNARISQNLGRGTYYIEVKGFGGSAGRFTLHAEMR